MVIAGIPTDQLLHTQAAQDLLDRGRQEGGVSRPGGLAGRAQRLRLKLRWCCS